MKATSLSAAAGTSPLPITQRVADWLARWPGADAVALLMRLGLAAVFWQSGRTKVEDGLRVSESAVQLFADEYRLPLLDPTFAAHLAAYAEHVLPLMLVIGLGTRFAAAGLLAMTLVIQFLVYPDAWSTHLGWAALALALIGRGAGRWSLDARLGWP